MQVATCCVKLASSKFITLWLFAMNYAISGHNQVPSCGNGWSYEELWPRLKNPVSSLLRAHVFGCPANVVDPALQDGHKIFKWDNCAQQGTFVGFSMEYSTSVPLVLNPVTGQIMPHSTMWCFMMPSPPLPLALSVSRMKLFPNLLTHW